MAVDVAVFGASSTALLLAGLLTRHGRSVCLVAPEWSRWRLPRRFDTALIAATRPESWRLLRAGAVETTDLLNGIAPGSVTPLDMLLVGERPATVEALAHLRATLHGFGGTAEQVADRQLGTGSEAWRFTRVPAVAPLVAMPALERWMRELGIPVRSPGAGTAQLRRDGGVQFGGPEGPLEAARAVLVDDSAIAAMLRPEEQARLLRQVPALTLRTDPAKSLAAPFLRYLDRGVTLSQAGRGEPITALVTGESLEAERLGASLAAQAPLRRVAEARHVLFETPDGAPLVSLSKAPRSLVVAGLGDAGVFFAPALARFIAGVPSEAEAAWFAAHDAGRGTTRPAVADYVAEGY